jgi:hypothetical protein
MTNANNGWPGAPGVPLNPERDGAHWIVRGGRIVPALWTAATEAWRPADKCTPFAGYSARGPTVERWRYLGPCLTPAEVAARVAAAKSDGMREAAGIARVHAAAAKRCADEGDVIHRIRAEYLANSFALNAAADDILAAIEKKEPTT